MISDDEILETSQMILVGFKTIVQAAAEGSELAAGEIRRIALELKAAFEQGAKRIIN